MLCTRIEGAMVTSLRGYYPKRQYIACAVGIGGTRDG
jgi:hypothetical protein